MRKRGKILREPRSGPGLLMIEGRQYWFGLEDIWKSGVAPKSALAVDVTLDDAGQILALTAVSESQLAEAERSVDTARELGSIRSPSKISAYCGQTEAALKMLRRTIEWIGVYCRIRAIVSLSSPTAGREGALDFVSERVPIDKGSRGPVRQLSEFEFGLGAVALTAGNDFAQPRICAGTR